VRKYIDHGPEFDDKLPRIAKPTDEQLKAADEQQRALAKRIGLQASPEQRILARAIARIDELNKIPRTDWTQKQLIRYIEALDMAGRFNEAYDLTGDRKYSELWDAIWKDDEEICDCPDTPDVVMENNRPVEVVHSRHFTRRRVYSLQHDKHVDLIVCNKCSHSNAKTDTKPVQL
jgi:hypothetical protein